MKYFYHIAVGVALIVIAVAIFGYRALFSAPVPGTETERFVVSLSEDTSGAIVRLKEQGFIRSPWALNFALSRTGKKIITPGGYKISKSMDVWEVAAVFTARPYMAWVILPEGKRKEELADILARTLSWSDEQKQTWLVKDTELKPEYTEGVYFPDTYLIPTDEPTAAVASRLIAKFQEKFAPSAKEALRQNIRWETVLKIASLIEREAAGPGDMPLIAGVIWNRLERGMPLGIDATLQYAKGKTAEGWWSTVIRGDTKINSPYNTYTHKGLPPHPIANPGLTSIDAVLHPEKTKCLYYLHDPLKNIHCAETYVQHKQNIETYLR